MTSLAPPKLRPMLAGKATDEQISKLFDKFKEMYASPKLDGIRCMIQDGVALSRSLKPIRNEFIQSILGDPRFDGLDGEIISGDPTADDVYRVTTGNVMRSTGKPDFTFWIFDNFMHPYVYMNRQHEIYHVDPTGIHPNIKVLKSVSVFNMKELQSYEQYCLTQGYEGVILRDPNGMYKHGRSTAKEGGLLKVKRFEDGEAGILAVEEQMKNNNEKKVNELGRSQRSSHKENKVPMGTLGALVCKDIVTGIQFNIGTGFTDEVRQQLWKCQDKLIGQTIKYKSFKIGVKDAPRHPVYLGMRDELDMS
jgi:DNA ligase-1